MHQVKAYHLHNNIMSKKNNAFTCVVCTKATSKYTCPKCRIPYCSVNCYTKHGTTCTEAFFRDHVEDELLMRSGGTSMTGPEVVREKKKMLDILKRTAGNEDLAEQQRFELDELQKLSLLAKKEDDISLDDLSSEQRRHFLRAVSDGSIVTGVDYNIINIWKPWWVENQQIEPRQHNHTHKPLISPVSSSSSFTTNSSISKSLAVRIFCLGDSITAGYTNKGKKYYPYSRYLEDQLSNNYVEVDYCGMCGWTTKNFLKSRNKINQGRDYSGTDGGSGIVKRIQTRMNENDEYHHIIIQLGINDILDVIQKNRKELNQNNDVYLAYAESIVNNIMELHQHSRNACPALITHAVTIPEPSECKKTPLSESMRLATNDVLKKVCTFCYFEQ